MMVRPMIKAAAATTILTSLLLVVLVLARKSSLSPRVGESQDNGYLGLVRWVQAHGGRVDERMAVRHVRGIRSVVSLEAIQEGTELMLCPWELVLGSRSMNDHMEPTSEADMCHVVQSLASEFRLGEESALWPYLSYIKLPRLGAMWDAAAVQELQGLPPSRDIDRHIQWYTKRCGGSTSTIYDWATQQALVAFVSRSTAVGMVPIYDLLNHHNGLKNAKMVQTSKGVALRTTRSIAAGEQLYLSYGLRPSSQMFRDYGFVSNDWPSLWSWRTPRDTSHVFLRFPGRVAAIHPSVDLVQEIWASPSRTLPEWQRNATLHNAHSTPQETLREFQSAAKTLLKGLPTAVQQDVEILERKHQERTALIARPMDHQRQELLALEDVMVSIQYRLTFKQAVQEALENAEETLQRLYNR